MLKLPHLVSSQHCMSHSRQGAKENNTPIERRDKQHPTEGTITLRQLIGREQNKPARHTGGGRPRGPQELPSLLTISPCCRLGHAPRLSRLLLSEQIQAEALHRPPHFGPPCKTLFPLLLVKRCTPSCYRRCLPSSLTDTLAGSLLENYRMQQKHRGFDPR